MDGFEDVAATLYSLEPGEFVAARDTRAKEARGSGDRDLARRIGALRRPSAAAWAVNQLVREHPEEMEQLLELGTRLRSAQDQLAGDELRELNVRRHAVLAAVLRRARAEAAGRGHPLSDAVARQVESTLRAALADPVAAAAVRSGLLVGDLEATGFGGVDVAAALAISEADLPAQPPAASPEARRTKSKNGAESPTRPTRDEPDARRREREEAEARRREREEARRAVEEAEVAAAQADRALKEAQSRVRDLGERRAELGERVRDLTRRLQETRAQDEEAAREEKRVRAEREAAAREARAAEREAARARTRRDQLG